VLTDRIRQTAYAMIQAADFADLAGDGNARLSWMPFAYASETMIIGRSLCTDKVLADCLADFASGALCPGSGNLLINMVPTPTIESTAAACLSIAANVNGIMDQYGGRSLLIEQRVSRTLGSWIGWPDALGVSVSGGKITMLYALRRAILRAHPDACTVGVPERVAIVASDAAHYSLESVCEWLGLGRLACHRVARGEGNQMDPRALGRRLRELHEQGIEIIAVVASGGTTLDFSFDDTAMIGEVVSTYVAECRPRVAPLLHLDAVIGWIFCLAQGLTNEELLGLDAALDPSDAQRILEISSRFSGMRAFDSMGVDLHKTGLAPYSSSFLVCRDESFLSTVSGGAIDFEKIGSGDLCAYEFTLENSRSMAGVFAAYVNLRTLGSAGYLQYLCSLYVAKRRAANAIASVPGFHIVDETDLGWAITFEVDLPELSRQVVEAVPSVAACFVQWSWARIEAGDDVPLIGLVPRGDGRDLALVYPMGDVDESDFALRVRRLRDAFVRDVLINGTKQFQSPRTPIR
jgi:glutamate/tyrosine decarboxylase-like PLP-dependent enzyme